MREMPLTAFINRTEELWRLWAMISLSLLLHAPSILSRWVAFKTLRWLLVTAIYSHRDIQSFRIKSVAMKKLLWLLGYLLLSPMTSRKIDLKSSLWKKAILVCTLLLLSVQSKCQTMLKSLLTPSGNNSLRSQSQSSHAFQPNLMFWLQFKTSRTP